MAAKRIEVDVKELQGYLDQARPSFCQEAYEKLTAALETLAYLTDLLEHKNISIARLRKIIFGAKTEKTSSVIKDKGTKPGSESAVGKEAGPSGDAGNSPRQKAKGHGRNGADKYPGAKRIHIEHKFLKHGQSCPKCEKGKIYRCKEPAVIVRITGQAPLQATVYTMARFRCNLCGEVFTAEAPEEVGLSKWDESASSTIANLKYGAGVPFFRLERFQENVGMPLPASTQWQVVEKQAHSAEPVFDELIRQAAGGEIFYNDDTRARILQAIKERRERERSEESRGQGGRKERTGTYTSGIVSVVGERKIALFLTGHQHAGENLRDVLLQRKADLPTPIQMCDGLSQNIPDLPEELKTIVANCNAHLRRKYVEVAEHFPEECRYVLEIFRDVYHNDAVARKRGMAPEERLEFHKANSKPRMDAMHDWMATQFSEKNVEPNSSLGQVITYAEKRWDRLTRFLEVPGAPLDNNIAERILKKAILNRKNSYFFKTLKGAHVADIFMSLIHTAELAKENPLDYLTELYRHAEEVAQNPDHWLPWNYRETIKAAEKKASAA